MGAKRAFWTSAMVWLHRRIADSFPWRYQLVVVKDAHFLGPADGIILLKIF